jgi:hypothetical protein
MEVWYTKIIIIIIIIIIISPWPWSASEQYRPSDRHLLAKLMLSFVDRGFLVVTTEDPYGRNLDCYFFFQVPLQLYSRA